MGRVSTRSRTATAMQLKKDNRKKEKRGGGGGGGERMLEKEGKCLFLSSSSTSSSTLSSNLVQVVDDLSIVLLQLRTLELHGGGNEIGLGGPLLGEVDSLGDLETSQLVGLGSGKDVLLDSLHEVLIVVQLLFGDLFQVNLAAVVLGPLIKEERVKGDDGDDAILQRVTIEPELSDPTRGGELQLNVLGGNVLSLSELEDVLLTIDDSKGTVFSELSDITSVVPAALLKVSSSLLGVLVVPRGDRGTSDANLTTRRLVSGQVVHLGDIDKLDLNRGNGSTNVVGGVVIIDQHGGTGGRGLGKTVTLDEGATEANTQEITHIRGQRSTTGNHEPQLSTERLTELLEDKRPGTGGLTLPDFFHPGAHTKVNKELHDKVVLRHLVLNSRLKAVIDLGDTSEDGGLEGADIVTDLSDITREETDLSSVADDTELDHPLENVSKREVRKMDISGEKTTHGKTGRNQGAHQVGVSVEDTLGHTSGTRGVHDDSQGVGLGGNIVTRVLTTQLLQLVEGLQLDVLRGSTLRDIADDNDGLESRALASNGQQLVQTSGGGDNQRELGVVDDVLDGSFAEGIVEGDGRQGLGMTGQVSQDPGEVVLGVDTDGVLRLDTEVTETRGDIVSALGNSLVGNPLVPVGAIGSKTRAVGVSNSSPLEARVKGDLGVFGAFEFLFQVGDIQEGILSEDSRAPGQGLALGLAVAKNTRLLLGVLRFQALGDFGDNIANGDDIGFSHFVLGLFLKMCGGGRGGVGGGKEVVFVKKGERNEQTGQFRRRKKKKETFEESQSVCAFAKKTRLFVIFHNFSRFFTILFLGAVRIPQRLP